MPRNKFQDYEVRFSLTDHFLVKRFRQLDPSFAGKLESCLLTARQIVISTGDFQRPCNVL